MYIRFVKRFIDFTLSLLALIVLSPVLLLLAILVRSKLGSPVLFKQVRPGLNEKVFTFYKFRTMTNETDESGKLLPDEKRLTRFGIIMRSFSLDELPQLFNIIKGNMSIIGPRPLLVSYLTLYSDEQRLRHTVRPGLVGLASVRGRNDQTWDDKFNHDIEYVKNLTFWLDCKIFFLAIYTVLNRRGVNQDGVATSLPFKGNEL
ncbi:MAG: sugar transferase [Clostridiales bacterium]|nr:sugar transferase [Clostridiales bacterium]